MRQKLGMVHCSTYELQIVCEANGEAVAFAVHRAGVETLRIGDLGIQISNGLIVGATANVELEAATYMAPPPDTDGHEGTLTTVGW